jgi:hypothetical protein
LRARLLFRIRPYDLEIEIIFSLRLLLLIELVFDSELLAQGFKVSIKLILNSELLAEGFEVLVKHVLNSKLAAQRLIIFFELRFPIPLFCHRFHIPPVMGGLGQ